MLSSSLNCASRRASISQPFYHFDLDGVQVKPYVRMTQRTKWSDQQAQQYLNSKAQLRALLRAAMSNKGWDMLPAQTPLLCHILIWVPAWLHRFDLDNVVKTILDAANGVVYPDDRWIDSMCARRMLGDARLQLDIGVIGGIDAQISQVVDQGGRESRR